MSVPVSPFVQDGVWRQPITKPTWQAPRPALFLDRDGVVVVEVNYLHKPEDMALEPGAHAAMRAAHAAGMAVVIVTNQAGIGYGLYDWPDFDAVQSAMLDDLTAQGALVDGVYACSFSAKGKGGYHHDDHAWRKPNPGMLLAAAEDLNLNLSTSWIVGDRCTDLQAGLNAGLMGGMQVLTGHGSREGEREQSLALMSDAFEVYTGESIADALHMISR